MRNDSSIRVTPALVLDVRTPDGRTKIKLSRLSAQILAGTLRAWSGAPPRDVEVNAKGALSTVFGESVSEPRPPVVKLGGKPGGRR